MKPIRNILVGTDFSAASRPAFRRALELAKANYAALCGLLAGSMTDPPALAFSRAVTGSDASSVVYAAVYPLTIFLRVVSAQLLVLAWLGTS